MRLPRWPLLLTALWLTTIACIGLGGNYPLNDDWAYAWSARTLAQLHHIVILDWLAPIPLFHIAWGAWVLRLTGADAGANAHIALRAAVLLWGWLGMLLTYGIGRRSGFDSPRAALMAAALALSPWYVNLSFTYMTDVPTLVCMLAAVWLLLPNRAGAIPKTQLFYAALALCCAALTRQYGILPLPAGMLAIWLHDRSHATPVATRLLRQAILLLPCILAMAAATFWYHTVHGTTLAYRATFKHLFSSYTLPLRHTLVAWHYIGWWALPWVLAWLLARQPLGVGKKAVGIGAGCLAAYSVFALLQHPLGQPLHFDWPTAPLMPYLTNVVYALGTGPFTLPDVFPGALPTPHAPPWLGVLLTLGSIGGGSIAGVWLFRSMRQAWQSAEDSLAPEPTPLDTAAYARLLGLLTCAAYAGFMFLSSGGLFDRYLLPLLPGALWLCLDTCPRTIATSRWAIAGVALMAIFSVGSTREYLAWNGARADAVADLQRQGIAQDEIDAGFELNATWRFSSFFVHYAGLLDVAPHKFWSRGTRFHVTLGANPPPSLFNAKSCQLYGTYPFWSWPGSGPQALHVVDCGPFSPPPRGYNPT